MQRGNVTGVRLRVFFALWPEARSLAAVRDIARDVARAREGRVSPERNLHVTMAFVGDVDSLRVPGLECVGAEVARAGAPFDLTFDRLGGNDDGVAWLAPGNLPDALAGLQQRLVERLEVEGFPTERRAFRPHVTLARHCAKSIRHVNVPPLMWPVTRLSLVVSTLAPAGSRYADLASWRLGDGTESAANRPARCS